MEGIKKWLLFVVLCWVVLWFCLLYPPPPSPAPPPCRGVGVFETGSHLRPGLSKLFFVAQAG